MRRHSEFRKRAQSTVPAWANALRDTHHNCGEAPGASGTSRVGWWNPQELPRATSRLVKAELLDASAAALDQDHEYDDKQDAGSNPDKRGTVHLIFPFVQQLVEGDLKLTGVPGGQWTPKRQCPFRRVLGPLRRITRNCESA